MFRGSIVALVTPFTENEKIDVPALERLVDWHVDAGTDAIICLGTTGEASTLTVEEKKLVIQKVVERVRGRIPVIVGTGCNATRVSIERTLEAKALGANGALIVVPYYNRPTYEGCYCHFEEIAKVGLPLIAYHHPLRTGVELSVTNLAQIAQIPNVVAIKEASGSLDFALELCKLTSVPVLSGNDNLTLGLMQGGGAGVCSIVANIIPELWKQFIGFLSNKDTENAKRLEKELFPLYECLVLETNPQCVKYALSLMGKCNPYMRLPLLEPRKETKKEISKAIMNAGLIS